MNIEQILDIELNSKSNIESCKGQVYRLRKTVYIGAKGRIVESISMSLLKRKSCLGCVQCSGIIENLSEDIDGGLDIRPDIEDQALYVLDVVDIGRDYETGVVDEWHAAFIKIKEEGK
jgi:hypothetical protein